MQGKSNADYLRRVRKCIRGVIWKVDEKFRDDISSALMTFALERRERFEGKSDDFLFLSLRNRCVQLNRREIKHRDRHEEFRENVFETESLSDNLPKVEQDQYLTFALIAAQSSKDSKIRRFIAAVISQIWQGKRFPIKEAQKKFGLRNLQLYQMLRGVRSIYGDIKDGKFRPCKMPKVRTLEDFKEQLYPRKRQRRT